MKTYIHNCILTSLAFAVMLASCTKVEPEGGTKTDPEEKKGNIPSITDLSSESLVLYPYECFRTEEVSFSVTEADSVWTVPGSGLIATLAGISSGKWKVTVSAKEAMGKTSTLEIKAKNANGENSATVSIAKAYFEIDRSSYESAVAGATVIVQTSSNVGCSCSVAADAESWIHTAPSGTGVSVTIDRNTLFEQRTGVITFSDSNGLLKKSFTVTQEAAIDYCKLEREALIALYNATDGKNWTKVSSTVGERDIRTEYWCTDKPVSQWYGVEVGGDGHVMYVRLNNMNLKGTLPEEIGDLVYCQEFIVSNNLLTGSLPSRIGDMQALKSLQAGGNTLSGALSSSTLSKLASKMKLISLSGNSFTGSFPEWIGDMPAQCNFWLQDNCLSGVVPQKVQNHAKWNASAMDGTGKTVGQINMEQKEGYILTLE